MPVYVLTTYMYMYVHTYIYASTLHVNMLMLYPTWYMLHIIGALVIRIGFGGVNYHSKNNRDHKGIALALIPTPNTYMCMKMYIYIYIYNVPCVCIYIYVFYTYTMCIYQNPGWQKARS